MRETPWGRARKKGPLRTRDGLFLIFGIAAFVFLIYVLAYYTWFLPIAKSMR